MSRGLIDNGSNKIYDETEIAQNLKEGEAIEKEENHRVHKTFTSQENPEHVQEDGNREAAAIIDMKFKKKKALLEFRCMVEDAVLGNYLLGKPPRSHSPKEAALARSQLKKITLWGVSLLPSKAHEGTDIVLLKFLKAKDYKVHDAFEMLRKTLKWRRDYLADLIQEDGLDPDVGKLVYSNCKDREGRPLYYNVCGAFKNRELPKKLVDLEDLCDQFIRLEVKFMEKGIKELNFKPGGANSIVQIIDLKNSKPPDIKKFRVVSKKTVMMLQDNYPELMHRNVSFFFLINRMIIGSVSITEL